MRRMRRSAFGIPVGIAALGLTGIVLAACTTPPTAPSATATSSATTIEVSTTVSSLAASVLADNEDATVVRPDEWSEADAVDVTLSGTTASSTAAGVSVDGSTVTIAAAGVYRLSGALRGQVVVAAPDDALVVLILDGAEISSTTGPAITVRSADDVAVHLAAGSVNALSDASSYAEDADANAALFSEEDLTVSGTGSLTVHGNGNDGITSEDDLAIIGGTITVVAADDALRGKDSLTVEDGVLTLTAQGGDALKSDNEEEAGRGYVVVTGGTVQATAGDDGIQAQTDVVITGGTLSFSVGDDGVHAEQILAIDGSRLTIAQSTEGLEAFRIEIASGEIDVTSSDDGLNASGGDAQVGESADGGQQLVITGGALVVRAEGDGLDSNGSISISGGEITVFGPTRQDNGALDSNGAFTISGGTLIALGSSGMAETPDAASPQGWVAAVASGAAGSTVQVLDASGAVLAETVAEKAFESVIVSAAGIASGSGYTISVDGTATTATAGQAIAGGMGGMPGGPGQGRP
ncbi:MAG: hypothetical protein BGO95_05050 [Micrococcales bacterium 73-13]|nr:MAG: hypothetical protein BGO95_05050 [Micrococcales bacterium 73-13]